MLHMHHLHIYYGKQRGMGWYSRQHPLLCLHAMLMQYSLKRKGRRTIENKTLKRVFHLLKTHLEKVILVHHTAVRQSLDQLIRQGGFTTISNSKQPPPKR